MILKQQIKSIPISKYRKIFEVNDSCTSSHSVVAVLPRGREMGCKSQISFYPFQFDIMLSGMLSSHENLAQNVWETQRDGYLTKWIISWYNKNCTDYAARETWVQIPDLLLKCVSCDFNQHGHSFLFCQMGLKIAPIY